MTSLIAFALTVLLAAAPEVQGADTGGLNPRFASAKSYFHYLNGQMLELSGRLPAALEQYKLAAAHDPSSSYLHLVLASMQARLFNLRAAVQQAQEAIILDPQYAEAHLLLGLLYRAGGDYPAAENALKSAISVDPRRLDSYLELSKLLLLQKRDAEANDVFQMMISNMPENPAGYFEMGRVFFEKRMLQRAVPYLAKAIEKDPAFHPAAFMMAQALELMGKYSEAVGVLESLHRYIGDDQDLMMKLGRLHFKMGDRGAAGSYFAHILHFAAGEVEARLKIAEFYLEEGEHEKALAELEELHGSFPEKENVAYWKGLALEEARRYEAAHKMFMKIPESSPLRAEAQAHAAFCILKSGNPQKAIRIAKALMQEADPPALAFYALSQAWGEAGGGREGVAFLKSVAARLPDNIEVVEALASLQEDLGDADGAKASIEAAMSRKNITPAERERLLFVLATIMERAGSGEDALAAAREILKVNPDSPEALNFVGFTLAEQGRDLKEAEEMISRALLFKPSSGYITDSLGWVYFRMRQFDRALTLLERADRLSPGVPEIMEHLGDALLELGRFSEGIEKYRKALKCKPDQKIRDRILKKMKDLGASG